LPVAVYFLPSFLVVAIGKGQLQNLLLLLLNRLPPDITGGQGLKKTFFKQYI
jgi:hypothetical protein